MKNIFIKNQLEKNELISVINRNKPKDMTKERFKTLKKRVQNMITRENIIFLCENGLERECLVADTPFENTLKLKNLHKMSHCGQNKFYVKALQFYTGFTREEAYKIVRECETCLKYTPLKTANKILPMVYNNPWEHVQIDAIDLRKYAESSSSPAWILSVIDCYSKYAFTVPLITKSAEEVKEALDMIFSIEGFPKTVQSDNGREFKNDILNNFLISNGVDFIHGRVRHPQSQGTVERFNQTITKRIAQMLDNGDKKNWASVLRKATFEYNDQWHRAINTSPFLAFKGRHGKIRQIGKLESTEGIIELPSKLEIKKIDENYREKYIQSSISSKSISKFNVDDFVLLLSDYDNNVRTKKMKLDPIGGKKGKIVEISNDNFYLVEFDNEIKKYCGNQLVKIFNNKE